jgi:hypothetical protein
MLVTSFLAELSAGWWHVLARQREKKGRPSEVETSVYFLDTSSQILNLEAVFTVR